MIRRNSIIIFAVFLVMLGGFLYIYLNPNVQTTLGMQTPTPTTQPGLITGFDLSSVSTIVYTTAGGQSIKIAPVVNNGKTDWYTDKKELVNPQTVSQAIQGLMGLSGTISPDQKITLDNIGLNPPQTTLVLMDSSGDKGTLYIGNPSITQTDYYVKWDNNPISLVPSGQITSLLGYFAPGTLIMPTPSPDTTSTP